MKLESRAKCVYEDECYLLDGAIAGDLIAASNSNGGVKLYKQDGLSFVGELKGHEFITDMGFMKNNPNVMITCDTGSVLRWDCRAGTSHNVGLRSSDGFTSVDTNCDGSVLAVGDGVDVLIYDVRDFSKPANKFEGFHTDVTTKVRFHPTQQNIISTGGEDGLLIVSDCTSPEDDATLWIYNCNNPVNTITYTTNTNVIATTSTEGLLMGCIESGDTIHCHERPDESLYIVGPLGPDQVLWGIKGEGNEHRFGELLIAPLGQTTGLDQCEIQKGGHKDLVRFALPHPTLPKMFTGGEDGFITLWGMEGRTGFSTASRIIKNKEEEIEEEPAFVGDCKVTVTDIRTLINNRKAKSSRKCK
eukprot:TRINITY_DN362_c7_g1_i1.p1 TRINITY_DN362_c7_g1~~TRINITY_DN362_c7_g1_i1.p1  ORF type:complete len:359 (+),score=81.66 TRINITY_DN362_c7_g1_i1:51-1127(+)